ncbi:transcription factor bHLH143 [Arachis duranensis]|uniref:transcription factor bHLH143 n=1 Tax=Arachis duranensis TaxID=130453 RepID=A0A6P4CRH7_ARADU|nr:transcription factor bHLH143 [Arachis duranensis]
MVKADRCLPRPQHVAWRYPYLNCFGMLEDPSILGIPACLNSTTRIFPAVNAFQGPAAPAIPGPKTEPTDELKHFLRHPIAKTGFKEVHTGGSLQNANPESLQRKFLIFDRSGNKTRMFYGPGLPHVQGPIISAREFPLACDINEKGWTSSMRQNGLADCSLPKKSDNDHVGHEESEMHEDTEEINALLYSDDDDSDYNDCDDDEVTSTDHSPLVTKRTYGMQEQFQHTTEGVASYDWPNKRPKLVDGGCNRSPQPVDSSSSLRPNENHECISDAESQNSFGAEKVGKSMAGDFQLKKDQIRELLRVLENLIPGAKGKQPLFVIDQTIEYLKSLASKTQHLE